MRRFLQLAALLIMTAIPSFAQNAMFFSSNVASTPPTRITSVANEGAGTSITVTIPTITAGNLVVWFSSELAASNSSSAPTVTNTCNGTTGTSTQLDIGNAGGGITNDVTAQGYVTGAAGTASSCVFTFSWSQTPGFVTAFVYVASSGHVDVHSLLTGQSGGSTVTTTSRTTSTKDLCVSGAVDAQANGGVPTVGTFTAHATNSVFGISDSDFTQTSAGAITAGWTFVVAGTVGAAVGMVCIAP